MVSPKRGEPLLNPQDDSKESARDYSTSVHSWVLWFPKLAERFGNICVRRNSVSGAEEASTTIRDLAANVGGTGGETEFQEGYGIPKALR
jgi:hypothetical protein